MTMLVNKEEYDEIKKASGYMSLSTFCRLQVLRMITLEARKVIKPEDLIRLATEHDLKLAQLEANFKDLDQRLKEIEDVMLKLVQRDPSLLP